MRAMSETDGTPTRREAGRRPALSLVER